MLGVAVIGGVIGLMAMSQSTAYAAAQPFAQTLSEAFMKSGEDYLAVRDADGDVFYEFDPRYEISKAWWDEVGRDQLLMDRPLLYGIDLVVLTDWFWFLLIAPIVGILFRVLFSQSHWIVCFLVASVGTLIAAGLTYLAVVIPGSIAYLGLFHPPGQLAAVTAGLPIAWMTFGVGLVSYLVAYMLAKPMLVALGHIIPTLPPMTGREPGPSRSTTTTQHQTEPTCEQ